MAWGLTEILSKPLKIHADGIPRSFLTHNHPSALHCRPQHPVFQQLLQMSYQVTPVALLCRELQIFWHHRYQGDIPHFQGD